MKSLVSAEKRTLQRIQESEKLSSKKKKNSNNDNTSMIGFMLQYKHMNVFSKQ